MPVCVYTYSSCCSLCLSRTMKADLNRLLNRKEHRLLTTVCTHTYTLYHILTIFIYRIRIYVLYIHLSRVDMVSLGAAQLWGDSDWAMVPLQLHLDHPLSSATATTHATTFSKLGCDRGGGGGRLGEKAAEEEIRRLSIERSFLLNK